MNESLEICLIRIAPMALCLVTNWQQVIRQGPRVVPEIIEIARNQNVPAAKIGFNVAVVMYARALDRHALREIVDAITKTILKQTAIEVWNPMRPSGPREKVIIFERDHFFNPHCIDKMTAEIAARCRF